MMILADLVYRDQEHHDWPLETALPLEFIPPRGEVLRLTSRNTEHHSFAVVNARFIVCGAEYEVTIVQDDARGIGRVERGVTLFLEPADQTARVVVAQLQEEQGRHWDA